MSFKLIFLFSFINNCVFANCCQCCCCCKVPGINKSIDKNSKKSLDFKKWGKIEKSQEIFNYIEKQDIREFKILNKNRIGMILGDGTFKIYEILKNDDNIVLKDISQELEKKCSAKPIQNHFESIIELNSCQFVLINTKNYKSYISVYDDFYNGNQLGAIDDLCWDIKNSRLLDKLYKIEEDKFVALGKGFIHIYKLETEPKLIYKLDNKLDNYDVLKVGNKLIVTNSGNKITIINLDSHTNEILENVESISNSGALCSYDDKSDIVFIGYNKGLNIISLEEKKLIKNIPLGCKVTSICRLNIGSSTCFDLLLGINESISGDSNCKLLQLRIHIERNKEINCKIVSNKKILMTFGEISGLTNSLFCNEEIKVLGNNGTEQLIFFTEGFQKKSLRILSI